MTHLELGQHGAKRQSWERANPRAILEELHRKNPKANYDELAQMFWDEISSDDDALRVIAIKYWFHNNYNAMIRPQRNPQRAAALKRAAAAVSKQVERGIKRQAQIMLLDLPMPNGKRLGDCTGKDCRQFGGWLQAIAAKVKPRQKVGDVLSESDLRALQSGE